MSFEIGDIVYEVTEGRTLAQKWTVTDVNGDFVGITQVGGEFQEEGIDKVVASVELVKVGSQLSMSNMNVWIVAAVVFLFVLSKRRK